jgi:cytochrome c5
MYGSGMNDIGDWDNNMAQGMMTLEEEREAFGETMPPRGGNNHGQEH